MTEDRARVGATLKALREGQGWTTEKFSEALGIARPTLSNIEAGRKRLMPEKAHRAAEILNVPLAAIVSPASDAATTRTSISDTDSTVIDLGDAGTIEVTLALRLFQMDQSDLNEVLGKLTELKDLGARIAAHSAVPPKPLVQ